MSRKILQIDTREVFNTFNLDAFTDIFPLVVDGEYFEVAGHVGPAIITIFDFNLSSAFNRIFDESFYGSFSNYSISKEEFQEEAAKYLCKNIVDFWTSKMDRINEVKMTINDDSVKAMTKYLFAKLGINIIEIKGEYNHG